MGVRHPPRPVAEPRGHPEDPVVNEIPFNPLHETGYRSIGCIPCTRPTAPDEEERAGRWAGSDKLECGIHALSPTGESTSSE